MTIGTGIAIAGVAGAVAALVILGGMDGFIIAVVMLWLAIEKWRDA